MKSIYIQELIVREMESGFKDTPQRLLSLDWVSTNLRASAVRSVRNCTDGENRPWRYGHNQMHPYAKYFDNIAPALIASVIERLQLSPERCAIETDHGCLLVAHKREHVLDLLGWERDA